MKNTLFKSLLLVSALLALPSVVVATIQPVGLRNWGLFNNRAKSHIRALDAWKIQEGSSKVVVAVVDTGIDPTHRDLAANLWHDPDHPEVYGWNYITDKPNPTDDHGHGTHIAGIIGAVADYTNGVSGVAHRVSIMPVKFYSDTNTWQQNAKNSSLSINYAVTHGAKIINYSGGGPEFDEDEYIALKRAEAYGVLVVAAAGNDHLNSDLYENYFYPAAYRLSNIISVASIDINNKLLPSSNWGLTRVDVAAPGENIFSTLPGNRFGPMSGTSQATAFVTGVAALLLSQRPELTPVELKQAIVKSVDREPALIGKIASGGHVDAYRALLKIK